MCIYTNSGIFSSTNSKWLWAQGRAVGRWAEPWVEGEGARQREGSGAWSKCKRPCPANPRILGRFLGVTCNPWPPTGWQGKGGDQRPGDVLCQIRLACLSSGMIQTLVQADRMENGAAGEDLRGPSFPSLRPGPMHRSGRPHMYAMVPGPIGKSQLGASQPGSSSPGCADWKGHPASWNLSCFCCTRI